MAKKTDSSETENDVAKALGLNGSGEASRSWLMKPHVMGAGLLILLLAVFLVVSSTSGDKRLAFVTEPVERGDLTVIVTATGTVQPTNEVDISSELSGIIRKVLVDFNSTVRVGQVLAELDTDKLEASVDSARAALVAARARIKQAEATVVEKRLEYERKRTLIEKNIISAHDAEVAKAAYDRAVAAVESARADSAAAEAGLKLAETNLAKTCICSPINGVVLNRDVEPGQIVASSLQAPVLFTIAEDLTKIEVQVDVDEADVGRVRKGQNATFKVDAYPDRTFTATISELRFGSEVVSGVVTYKAVLTTSNPDLLLRPGMTATAEVVVKRVKDAIAVPNAALRFSPPAEEADGRSFLEQLTSFRPQLRKPSENLAVGPDRTLWILADGEVKGVPVTIGVTDGTRTQIVKGDLKPGQAVIVDTAATDS